MTKAVDFIETIGAPECVLGVFLALFSMWLWKTGVFIYNEYKEDQWKFLC